MDIRRRSAQDVGANGKAADVYVSEDIDGYLEVNSSGERYSYESSTGYYLMSKYMSTQPCSHLPSVDLFQTPILGLRGYDVQQRRLLALFSNTFAQESTEMLGLPRKKGEVGIYRK